jgi:hypothetical protein
MKNYRKSSLLMEKLLLHQSLKTEILIDQRDLDADAQKAKAELDGKEFDGRSLRVDDAKEPRERGQRNERSGGYGFNRRSRF